MKKILLFTYMLVTGLCITSCSKDDGGSNGNLSKKLEGMWACTEDYWAEWDERNVYDNCTDYLLEFTNGVIKEYEGDDEYPFVNGYITGSLRDFELCYVAEFELKGNEVWIGGFLFFEVEFISKDKMKLYDIGDSSGDYSIYERVKGFN